jgi:hypothetical protein
MKIEKRSPLKDKPLRVPGQSLEEERQELLEDKIETPLLVAVVFVAMASMEWSRYYTNQPPKPVLFTVLALGLVAFTAWRFWRLRPRLRGLRQAIEGERVVGQFLERLRESGYQVFHDVVGEGFNVDHVVIGPAGVLTIETKTRSKPAKGGSKISFDGERILVDGFEPDRDPVVQAKAQAAWLRQLLAESTGRQLSVRPVVVFPGWFVEQTAGSTREIWVLEPKALPKFLEHEPAVLAPEDVKLVSFHLSRFIRAEEQRRSG